MYEAEANTLTAPRELLAAEALADFAGLNGRLLTRTVLSWSEHCTECVWPTCYTSCDLYSPRPDGRCRRFVDGMVRVDCPEAVNGYLLQIRFKQWGKLWTPGNLNLRSLSHARRIEGRDHGFGTVLHTLPMPSSLRNVIVGKRYGLKKRLGSRTSAAHSTPTSFLLECFNPTDRPIPLSITVRSAGKNNRIPFQRLAPLEPGFQLVRIPFDEIAAVVDLGAPFNVELIPNDFDNEVTLYFGLMEFVEEVAPEPSTGGIKCVVWDLDNTLWSGVLVEDGAAALRLKPGILDVMLTLDRHGVLQSVASKNNHEEALEILKRLKIDHLFLYPQISWAPKGQGIRAIAHQLNIDISSLLFVDDSEFELAEVGSSCPDVQLMHAADFPSLLHIRECQLPVTKESVSRREMYVVEQERKALATSFKDDYKAFLKHCEIRLTIAALADENLERVHELTQRTNQMNFSGTRYDRDRLREIIDTPHLQSYVLTCDDRFGSYGIVGFGLVDTRQPVLTDLMFSCRIQSKRVEHAFLAHIMRQYLEPGNRDFHALYRKTPRNAPSGQVFADLGMEERGTDDGLTSLFFSSSRDLADDGIVEIITEQSSTPLGQTA